MNNKTPIFHHGTKMIIFYVKKIIARKNNWSQNTPLLDRYDVMLLTSLASGKLSKIE